VASRELQALARQLRDAIAAGNLAETQRLLDLIDGKPGDDSTLAAGHISAEMIGDEAPQAERSA
jgi:hypothetical protein